LATGFLTAPQYLPSGVDQRLCRFKSDRLRHRSLDRVEAQGRLRGGRGRLSRQVTKSPSISRFGRCALAPLFLPLAGLLLAATPASGRSRRSYPTLQFNADGSVVDGLRAVRDALWTQNPWAILGLRINPQDALGDHRPIARLRAGASSRCCKPPTNFATLTPRLTRKAAGV
jgi:hypothetical protein